MKFTDIFKLKKPETTDAYNVDDFNENMDAVDAQLKTHSDEISELKNPAYTIAQTLAEPESGEDCTTFLGKVKKAIKDLIAHLSNTSNPHKVTASQVGLGNVPNVATNNQTPTYTESSSLANLVSGEKLSVAFGKIKKSITDLIAHLANKTNPHSVTYTQTGAAAEKHEHESYLNSIAKYYASADNMSADDLTVPVALIYMSSELNSELCSMFKASFAFILTVFYGGTVTVNRRTQVALSYNNNPSKIAIRSYISESSGWTPWKNVTNDSTNILPIDSGGTGAATVADVLKNLGLSTITTDVKNAASVAANAKSIAENHSHDDYLRAIATYYSSGMEADNLTVPWALIHAGDDENIELYNIIGSGFIYVMTLFYNKQDLTSRRVQLAFNYSSSDSRMAIRHFYASGWTPWKPVTNDSRNPLPIDSGGTGATTTAGALINLGLVTEDISDSFLSEVISGCTVTSKSVYKYGNVISGTITFNYTPADDEVFVNLFVISQTYRPKTDIIQVQLSLKREEEVLFPTSIAYFDTGSFTMNAMGMTYDSGLVSFCYICN